MSDFNKFNLDDEKTIALLKKTIHKANVMQRWYDKVHPGLLLPELINFSSKLILGVFILTLMGVL